MRLPAMRTIVWTLVFGLVATALYNNNVLGIRGTLDRVFGGGK